VISIVGSRAASTALVMEKVSLPLPGTWNVPADADATVAYSGSRPVHDP
jgi:hypothetical protein